MQKKDICNKGFKDNSVANCEFNAALLVGHLVSLDLKKKIEINSLSKATIKAMIASRELYLVKGYVDAPENEVSGVKTAQTGYGNTLVTSNSTNLKISYNLPYSQCQFRALKSWSNVPVLAFPIDANDNIGGTLVVEDGKFYTRGQKSKFIVPESLPFKFNENDIVVSTFIWLADKVKIDTFDAMNVEVEELDGIVSVNMEVTEATTAGFKLNISAGCNGTGIEGADGDLVVLDSNGDPVSTTIVDVEDGNYTVAGALPAGSYSVNFASEVVEIGDSFFAALENGVVIETT